MRHIYTPYYLPPKTNSSTNGYRFARQTVYEPHPYIGMDFQSLREVLGGMKQPYPAPGLLHGPRTYLRYLPLDGRIFNRLAATCAFFQFGNLHFVD